MVEYHIRLELINEMSVLSTSNCIRIDSNIDYKYAGH